jgi:hypothetical protein
VTLLRDQILAMARGEVPTQAYLGTVQRVDRAQAVCDVQPAEVGAPILYDVSLRALAGSGGFILWPALGSFVIVSLVDNDPNSCYVAACTDITQFTLATAADSLGKLWADLFSAVAQLTVPTGTGPSGPPLNLPAFQLLAQRAAVLFAS